ncbi:bifunctional 3-(3-hydroxy-phenyl)propionate/3-hydroxycinnamic acid hydroxylase [Micromonospora sp. MA102]|uniref:bifunctional 3-(3-hydroxy-phenyl)propionate/3-hydroxycinnamic acid hydroxylase n=1 Tax=Micromonospora sp. MA102 TaxID=2952755 RepID=UPI0021C736E9|nr:bifunctional 3-(3-hydroxy-phenyl)propionate/3-hydroxycinnamic acid hydroxylase [Micromonospora sp. MA102]
MTGDSADVDVLVVGAGPTGLVVANLLAAAGVTVVVVEKNSTTSDEAKAISVDDESLRVFQRAGVLDVVRPVVLPGTGTRYFDRAGRRLTHARGARPLRLGHPSKSPFAQPLLETALLKALSQRPRATVRFAHELRALRQDGTGVVATVGYDGDQQSVRSTFLLGCDGGRSTVRLLTGIDMTGESYTDHWLVADTLGDPHDERYGLHYGQPDRPHVIVPGQGGRCRYEFLLRPDEVPADRNPSFELIQQLVGPYRRLTPDQVERATTYTFNAVVADRWRLGRVFLLGDAAHMMPPFAGQGLNSGIRDADNLSWKLALVLRGYPDRLLDTYEPERRPHAEAMVKHSVDLGRIVMTTKPLVALARDVVVRAMSLLPAGRRYLSEMRFRPKARYLTAATTGAAAGTAGGPTDELLGRILPQPRVLMADGRIGLLDEALGDGFALLAVATGPGVWDAVAGLGVLAAARRVDVILDDRNPDRFTGDAGVADIDGLLQSDLAAARGRLVLVRPDRYVAAVFRPTDAAGVARNLAAAGLDPSGVGDSPLPT